MDAAQTFTVTLLGTGCPVVSPRRYGAGTLVECAGKTILVDIGSGVTQRLVEAGNSGKNVDALLLTHLHSDHLVDLYQFIISSWHQNRDRPQVIWGPPGTKRFVDAQLEAWRAEHELRIAFEQRTSTAAFDIEVHEFAEATDIVAGAVRAVKVEYPPVEPAFGYVFEAGGRKLVLSGDTRPCPALVEEAAGADLLVHEVYAHRHDLSAPATGTRSSETLKAVESYHTVPEDVGRVAAEAGVKRLVLNHIVPPDADEKSLIARVRTAYAGPVIVGEDLMQLDLLTGIVRHGRVHLSI
jgi:ribonuclease Z